ncbi:nicotinate-nucleotide adenylyltransferase [Cupriavidus metallidurans]|jgi:nicotinate-nucleotide adenylyltransferase|uniref:Probable nicotinate-nucleotide adenylyltransferase n=1 Tax=Cupriavidus metallidurans (strain ATCC 43123 / DSM 2839 / NBRC 102507 / CH34) TaxID=266264 RepID=Q1LQA8_CUPMC|nr:nicotinate-nucleotide adenylyltransferase [Cupriavidus metallidurans]ABF07668.1 nicotinic acid mono-nucleotide adenylyltransferase [Cupriavidus metallidurans CH34]AVA32914.1 nicotinate-nucleotide adenylyltransferase [Cupriavidus metallidurans]MDE4917098.1 nicotinate-nucleotide adenylyltransferase [Cupriavidus metallidurans]QGS28027.1 nicotinate-nucleotide adenylyltransferase [Cupriavidus metallidurans]UBM11815.1 nicotinate-nucleotide adenylyltransferase [Cupriavidus metallidurans]
MTDKKPATANRQQRPYRLGILGGTFDPPHRGHVALAQLCIDHLDLDELVWIPTGHSWQKGDHVTPAADRLAMTELAAGTLDPGRAKVRVSRMEVEREGPSYTIDTVRQLRAEYGADTSMSWLMGADQLLRLHTWHGWEALFEQVHLCIATRPGFDLAALDGPVLDAMQQRLADTHLIQCTPSGHMWIDQTLAVDLSSTGLRQRLADGPIANDPADDQLPAGVAHYIARHGLYQQA